MTIIVGPEDREIDSNMSFDDLLQGLIEPGATFVEGLNRHRGDGKRIAFPVASIVAVIEE